MKRAAAEGGSVDEVAAEKGGKESRVAETYHGAQMALSLTEKEVGIELFIREGASFSAIFKHRYSDFIVREIGLDGKVVRLAEEAVDSKKRKKGEGEVGEGPKADPAAVAAVAACLGGEQGAQFTTWIAEFDPSGAAFLSEPITDKERRSALHGLVKQIPFLFSETENGRVAIKSRTKMNNQDRTRELGAKGRYVRFALCKENKETTDAVSVLCQKLRVNSSMFSWAGTKDKRGVTTQLVTAFKMEPNRLRGLNPHLFGLKVGNIEHVAEQLHLGDLLGNQFEVTLRDVQGPLEGLEAALSSLSTLGFVNYYGMQRFGSSSVPTHAVGCAMLKEDWRAAGEAILRPRGGERPDFAQAREVWAQTHDPAATLRALPRQMYIERMLLQGLAQHGANNYRNALSGLPRNLRMLYLHAYQSYVWNRAATKRIQLYGLRVMVGDLVALANATGAKPKSAAEGKSEKPDDEVADLAAEEEEANGGAVESVKTIETADEAAKYSIHDVVLPLPGSGITYPAHDLRSEISKLLEGDGLAPTVFDSLPKDLYCRGAYRRLVQLPRNMQWRTQRYSDASQQFTLTDMDVIAKKELPPLPADGPHLALIMSFELPPGTYATMLFREFLRRPGEFSAQKVLSAAHNEKEAVPAAAPAASDK